MIFQLLFHLIHTSAMQCFCMNFDGKEKLSARRLVRTSFRNWPLVRAFHQVGDTTWKMSSLFFEKPLFLEVVVMRKHLNKFVHIVCITHHLEV